MGARRKLPEKQASEPSLYASDADGDATDTIKPSDVKSSPQRVAKSPAKHTACSNEQSPKTKGSKKSKDKHQSSSSPSSDSDSDSDSKPKCKNSPKQAVARWRCVCNEERIKGHAGQRFILCWMLICCVLCFTRTMLQVLTLPSRQAMQPQQSTCHSVLHCMLTSVII